MTVHCKRSVENCTKNIFRNPTTNSIKEFHRVCLGSFQRALLGTSPAVQMRISSGPVLDFPSRFITLLLRIPPGIFTTISLRFLQCNFSGNFYKTGMFSRNSSKNMAENHQISRSILEIDNSKGWIFFFGHFDRNSIESSCKNITRHSCTDKQT